MNEIIWEDFENIELRVGPIVKVLDFPEARKATYRIVVDFREEIGMKKFSA